MAKTVYLDNAATTRLHPQVEEAMRPFWGEHFGNASSLHAVGRRARKAVEDARETVAHLLKAQAREIVFTSGGTEADNLALFGVAYALKSKGRHLITNRIEHSAILNSAARLEKEGFEVTYLPVDRFGMVDIAALEKAIRADTALISIMLVNNEVGTIQPLSQIAALAKSRGVLLHTDAVQAMGKMAIDVSALGVDLLSLSAHKFHGPKGCGALYVRQGVSLLPRLFGGPHEFEKRAGTENVAGIVGLARALELAHQGMEERHTCLRLLAQKLERGIFEAIPQAELNGHREQCIPHILNIRLEGVDGEALLLMLDQSGICVSTGSACAAESLEASHVLLAMGLSNQQARGSVRFSFSRETTKEDVDFVLATLPSIVAHLRELSPLPSPAR